MNKKIILLLILFTFLFSSVYVFADVLKVISAFATFVSYKINHTPITNVSSVDKSFNAKISVDFGNYVSADAKINYYLDGSSSTILHSQTQQIENNKEFYISLSDIDGNSLGYQIQIDFKDSYGNNISAYSPSENIFNATTITNSTSVFVNVSDGATVEFVNGNQEYSNTKLYISTNSLGGNTTIIIKQLPLSSVNSASSLSKTSINNNKIISLYSVTSEPLVEIFSPLKVDFFYGLETDATKFLLKYRKTEADSWKNISITNVDLSKKIISANISKWGEYAIFVDENYNDNDYRPARRVIVKSRVGGETGFWFEHLTEGDTVKIYDVTGKKVAEINSGTERGFVWYGKNSSGGWVESGTYIYQIKVKGRSKLISGTIAFVK